MAFKNKSGRLVPTFLICGGSGQIGQSLVEAASSFGVSVVAPSSRDLDITDRVSVSEALMRHKPTLIINAAAYTDVDGAEDDAERAFAINCGGPHHLAEAAERAAIPIFHISSDYVFSGNGTSPIPELHATQPCSTYGMSKLAGEQAVTQFSTRHIVLRTSWVYGIHGSNFVKTMLRLGGERAGLSVVNDQFGCPTYAASISSALLELAVRYLQEGDLPWGIYHYSGRSACSWYEFATEIFRLALAHGVLTQAPEINPVLTHEYPTPARRPAWSVLDCQKFESTFGINTNEWKNDLQDFFTALPGPPTLAHAMVKGNPSAS